MAKKNFTHQTTTGRTRHISQMAKKRSQKAVATNQAVEAALTDLRAKVYKTVNAAAKAHGAPESTVRRRWKGGNSRAQGNEGRQLLSANEEKALVQWIHDSSASGYPPRKHTVIEMAEEIRKQCVAQINDATITLVNYPPIGIEWITRFIKRHSTLQTLYARQIDSSRVKETTVEAITRWLNTVQEILHQYNIRQKNVYNIDETGFAIGSTQAACVLIDARLRSKIQAQPGRQEWVTAIECICADGTVIKPLLIFRGEQLSTDWLIPKDLTDGWHFSCSTRGWTSDIHGLEWLRRCFEPATREKANGNYRLLILDGHGSHETAPFLGHCRLHKILVLRLPPHTSHLLQPLDVGLFGPLKKILSVKIDSLIRTAVSRIQKCEWLLAFVEARKLAFKRSNIEGGWRGAGLFPFDSEKVLRHIEITEPSEEPTSALQQSADSTIDPNLFNNSLLTSSPSQLNIDSFRQTASMLRAEVAQPKVLATPVRHLIPRLTDTTERLHAENSILKTRLKAATEVLAARKQRKRGKRIALKDQLLLTTDEIYKAVEALDEEAKKRRKKQGKRKPKRKISEVMSESEDESKDVRIQSPLPAEILDCVVVAQR